MKVKFYVMIAIGVIVLLTQPMPSLAGNLILAMIAILFGVIGLKDKRYK